MFPPPILFSTPSSRFCIISFFHPSLRYESSAPQVSTKGGCQSKGQHSARGRGVEEDTGWGCRLRDAIFPFQYKMEAAFVPFRVCVCVIWGRVKWVLLLFLCCAKFGAKVSHIAKAIDKFFDFIMAAIDGANLKCIETINGYLKNVWVDVKMKQSSFESQRRYTDGKKGKIVLVYFTVHENI